jgi:hypothetical protein
MRRIGRYILAVLALVSLVVFLATPALWLRSRDGRGDQFDYIFAGRHEGDVEGEIIVGTGREGVHFWHGRTLPRNGSWFYHVSMLFEPWALQEQCLGLAYEHDECHAVVILPFWFVAIASAIVPAAWLRRCLRLRAVRERGFDVQPIGAGDTTF